MSSSMIPEGYGIPRQMPSYGGNSVPFNTAGMNPLLSMFMQGALDVGGQMLGISGPNRMPNYGSGGTYTAFMENQRDTALQAEIRRMGERQIENRARKIAMQYAQQVGYTGDELNQRVDDMTFAIKTGSQFLPESVRNVLMGGGTVADIGMGAMHGLRMSMGSTFDPTAIRDVMNRFTQRQEEMSPRAFTNYMRGMTMSETGQIMGRLGENGALGTSADEIERNTKSAINAVDAMRDLMGDPTADVNELFSKLIELSGGISRSGLDKMESQVRNAQAVFREAGVSAEYGIQYVSAFAEQAKATGVVGGSGARAQAMRNMTMGSAIRASRSSGGTIAFGDSRSDTEVQSQLDRQVMMSMESESDQILTSLHAGLGTYGKEQMLARVKNSDGLTDEEKAAFTEAISSMEGGRAVTGKSLETIRKIDRLATLQGRAGSVFMGTNAAMSSSYRKSQGASEQTMRMVQARNVEDFIDYTRMDLDRDNVQDPGKVAGMLADALRNYGDKELSDKYMLQAAGNIIGGRDMGQLFGDRADRYKVNEAGDLVASRGLSEAERKQMEADRASFEKMRKSEAEARKVEYAGQFAQYGDVNNQSITEATARQQLAERSAMMDQALRELGGGQNGGFSTAATNLVNQYLMSGGETQLDDLLRGALGEQIDPETRKLLIEKETEIRKLREALGGRNPEDVKKALSEAGNVLSPIFTEAHTADKFARFGESENLKDARSVLSDMMDPDSKLNNEQLGKKFQDSIKKMKENAIVDINNAQKRGDIGEEEAQARRKAVESMGASAEDKEAYANAKTLEEKRDVMEKYLERMVSGLVDIKNAIKTSSQEQTTNSNTKTPKKT